MKKVMSVVAVASILASTTAFALTYTGTNTVGMGVVGSKHDMNKYTETTQDAQGRVCAFCHTPHHALADDATGTQATADYLPLWSHKLTTQKVYTPYFTTTVGASATGTGSIDLGSSELSGPSILCMSCHDGSIAVDQHYGGANTGAKLNNDGFNGTAIGLADAGGNTSLSNDHPIGFLYADAVAAHPGDLNAATTKFAGNTKNKTINDQLTGGMMTCATCHDVHNKDNAANSTNANVNYFLMGDQNGSAFCLTCHNK